MMRQPRRREGSGRKVRGRRLRGGALCVPDWDSFRSGSPRGALVRMVKGEGAAGGAELEAGSFENGFQLAGADDGVDFRNVFLDFVAIALDKAAGDDELSGAALSFEAGHFEDGIDGFLLGGVNEGAGVDDEDFGVFRPCGEARAGSVKKAHHDLGVDEVFGAAEGDESHGRGRGRG